ncbi:MAG: T9SS type A sorting domain-containing protein [Ignavibacteriae bacterium]|nr:T9SS type A sorting domain-containing protein [Ignavibacteriota bacterium]MCB9216399.1 T9SS type A sorting domain-containing protein [Ignavibacteria bacterium]
MYFQLYHIVRFLSRIPSPPFGRILFLFLCLGVTLPTLLNGQSPNWRYDTINTTVGTDLPITYTPQVAFDRWGVAHFTWVTRDPNSAGLQVYHTDNQSGELSAPFLLTDTGTVYDRLSIDSTSHQFVLGPEGVLHLAFLANVAGPSGFQIGLFYANDSVGTYLESPATLLTNMSARYDIAVDSFGVAHIVWLTESAGKIALNYWNNRVYTSQVVTTIPCSGGGCSFSDPQLAIHNGQLEIFLQNDSGAVWHAEATGNGVLTTIEELPIPHIAPPLIAAGANDLRIRLALDSSGAYHLLLPRQDPNSLPSLFYATNGGGFFSLVPLTPLDSTLMGFDIASDGNGVLGAVWTSFRGRFNGDRPKTGYAGYSRDAIGRWQQTEFVSDLNIDVGNPQREWRVANNLAIVGDHIYIIGQRYFNRADPSYRTAGLFLRSTLAPKTAYMLPDAGAPGMSVVVETYAPTEAFGTFGVDTLNPTNVGLEVVNPKDSQQVVIGPSVVSWDGRLLSTMLFIHPDATPGDVPLRVRVGDSYSNKQIFSIVRPQRLGIGGSGILQGGGVLGSGGIYGKRSRRGVLVVDSLTLRFGTYTAETSDLDPDVDGVQGFLPLTILAAGEVTIDSTAILSVSAPSVRSLDYATYGVAGSGGGGGGGGSNSATGGEVSPEGGGGYTAGGVPSGALASSGGGRFGSGGYQSGRYSPGRSLNGVPGGGARPHLTSGGGTGHPFGSSGRYGRLGEKFPLEDDPGGYGGGTGGATMGNISSGGGGGSHALPGEDGGPLDHNGGRAVGSSVLVPISGGGGGGGAFSTRGRVTGGGGGGALALYSRRAINLSGEIHANGADGIADSTSAQGSGGGGGAGGGVLIGGQGGLVIGTKGKISVEGGMGGGSIGPGTEPGGTGGRGRVRVDGRIDFVDSATTINRIIPGYIGPASDLNGIFQAESGAVVSGVGVPGRTIRIYVRPEFGSWSYQTPRDIVVDTNGVWSISLGADEVARGLLYVAVLEKTENPSSDRWRSVPQWIMSTAGGAIVGQPNIQIDRTNIDFGCVNYPDCKFETISITNTGTQSDLVIQRVELDGGADWFLIGEVGQGQLRIPPGVTATLRIALCPPREGEITATLRLITNVRPDSVRLISLVGCGVVGKLASPQTEIDLGDLCPGSCIDTLLTLTNEGKAPLDVTSIAPVDKNLSVEIISPELPLRINSGESQILRVRACLQGSGGDYIVSFRATTPLPFNGILFRVQNIGPDVALPLNLDMGRIDVGADDTCRVETFTLRNRSEDRSIQINALRTTGVEFELLSPTVGTQIPPKGEVQVVVRFCGGDTVGSYAEGLLLQLASGSCLLDTVVQLHGEVAKSTPALDLNVLDKVDFGSVQVGSTSIPREVRIVNRGKGIARNVVWTLTAINPTTLDETNIVGSPSPLEIAGERFESFTVTMTPAELGLRQAKLIFSSSDGWRDTVLLCVNGVEPGITADTFYLNFGGVRLGSNLEKTLRIFNQGSFTDSVMSVEVVDQRMYNLVNLSAQLPVELKPTIDNLLARVRFAPTVIGDIETELKVTTKSGNILSIILAGTGLLEKAEVDIASLLFPCPEGETGIDSILVRNTGTWPLTVNAIQIGGLNSSAFRLLDIPAPDVIPPDGSRWYRVEYIPGATIAESTLRVLQSGRDQIVIELQGERCEPEEFYLAFSLPEITDVVGAEIVLPLLLETTRPVPETIPFSLVVTYESTLLMPEGKVEVRPLSATNLKGSEATPGELLLEGTIPEGTVSGTLLEVPLRVLLGKTYQTDLELSFDGNDLPSYYRLLFDNGTFTALDCDTTGTIDLGGAYGIKQSVPNPADGVVVIDFEIARRELVSILLYDAAGTVINRLLDQVLDGGTHRLSFDTSTLSAGLYYYEIQSGRYRKVERMVIVK